MAILDSLTGRGATRVTLSVLEGMGRRSVREQARKRWEDKTGHTIMW